MTVTEGYYETFQKMLAELRSQGEQCAALVLREFDARLHDIDPSLAIKEEMAYWTRHKVESKAKWPA